MSNLYRVFSLLFYGVISIYIRNKYNILIILKKRILYIILGIMLLSKVGVGQSFTLDASSNAYPAVNCDQTTFILTNNTGSTIWYRLYLSSNDIDWTDISLAGSSQRLNAGATFSINVQSDGYYKIHYAGSTTVSLSSSSLPSIQTIIKSSPTIITEVSNLDYAICLNSTPTNLSVTANAGSGTISQYAWYSNINNSNVGGSVAVTNINSSTTDFFIPNTSIVGNLYYYPIVSNSFGCSTVGSQSGKITVNALPVINSLMDTTKVCGTKTILDAGAGYSSYSWSNGSTERYISTDVSQNYFLTVTNASSCSSIDSTFLSLVDAKLFNSDTTILAGASVNINAHGILNSADRAVLYDFSNVNALNDFNKLITDGATITLTSNGQAGNGVELVRASTCCSDAEMKTTKETFGYGTYEVDAYSASGIADQSFGIMEQSGSWVNRVLNIGTRPNGTDNQGWDVVFKGINIASSNTSPVSNSTWYKIKVYITPTTLKVWLNTTVIFDGALPSAITNPRGAIRVGAYDVSRYDNIKYTPLQELSYLWSTSSTNQNITVTPTVTSTYQLKVTDQTTTCNSSVDIRVLKINITNTDASICNNTTQTLYIDSSFSKYPTWQTKNPGIEFYNIKKDLNGNLYALPSLNNQKIYKSIDRGETWNQMAGFPNLGGFNFMALGVDQNNVIYASTNDEGIYKSTDEGVTWTQLQDFRLFGTGPMDILFGNNFSILTVKGIDRGIWTSTGDLVSWQQKIGGFDPNTVTQDINGYLYSGGSSGLYRSINAGASWSNISSSYGVHIIRADSSGKVFLTEGGTSPLLVSSDQGASFSSINSLAFPNVGVAYPQDILFTKNNMFITKGQVHYSKNNGADFTQLEKITFPTAGAKNYGGYGDSTNRMEMIGNRLFVASLDGIKFIDVDNLNTTVTWSTGQVGNKIEVNPISTSPGNTVTYSATVSYGAVTGSDQVTFTLPTKPTITASGATTFCQGGSVTLTANASPAGVYSYTWQTGAITQGITVASAGSYSVTAVNSIGCSETSTPTIITVNDLPAAPIANSVSLNYNGLQQTTPDLIPPSGQSISWFTLPVGGVNSSKPQGTNVGTYNSYANAIIDATGCISSSRTLVFLTINKKSITITVDPNQTKVYGAANPSTYTYGVSPSLTGLAALNGTLTRVSGESVGTYAIEQNDLTTANNPNYTINYIGNNFTITKKSITITATAGQSKVYGATDPSSYAYTLSAPLFGTDALSGALTRVAGETVGPYAINQGTLTNANYDITYVGNNFTITKKALTITATPGQTKIYGAADPSSYAYTLSAPLFGTDALSGALTRVAGETVGPYAINQGTLTNANYDITYVGNNFTITKKALTITATPGQTKVYGAADPSSYAYTLSTPLLTGDALSGALTRVAGETVGPYAINQGTLTNANYDITYIGNNFTITQKPITITADAGQTKVYGAANPATYTYAVSPSLTGLATLNGSLIRVAGEPVGTYAIQQNDLTTANNPNYTITYVGNNFIITTAPLSITGITGANKIYDGTTIATINGTASYVGLVAADAGLAVTGTPLFNFNNKNVGTAKPITVSGFTAPSSNYSFTQPTGLTGDITPKQVIIIADANDKQYDGNTTATLNNITSPGFISGDLVTINYASATFDTKEVGTNKTVTVTGINLASLDAPNYFLATTIATALADITAPLVFIFEVPNAFTPNGDGLNDILKIIGNAGVTELKSFKIYSRSGNLVFESRDISIGWDGTYKSNLLPSDVYYWTAVYVDRNNQTNSKTGNVLLLK